MDLYSITSQHILDRISRHCPESLSAYLQCINRSGIDGTVFFSRTLVEVDMSETWTLFRNNIKKLAIEGLLEWHPFDNGIAITLSELEEENDEE